MKRIIVVLVVLVLLGGVWYFFFFDRGDTGPSNLPTQEDIQRMEEIEASSAQIAPNAVPGAGVRPKGSTPPKPEPTPTENSSTTTNETETGEVPVGDDGIEVGDV
jgi:flagellar basal body-associated protein FliL